jgi:hypothetical protein
MLQTRSTNSFSPARARVARKSPLRLTAVVRAFPISISSLAVIILTGCHSTTGPSEAVNAEWQSMRRITVSSDTRGFVFVGTRDPFHPWGMNYGNAGRLIEDFWDGEWETLAGDFRELKALGANVVRVHLQFGRFMDTADTPNPAALRQLRRLLLLAEKTDLYLDVTGLACYRKADVPSWYDALDEPARWRAQAVFWRSVATVCARSPAVFCYDLINEPLAPADQRKAGDWYSGKPFGGYDFLQYIALNRQGRKREDIAVAWIEMMTRAIREKDPGRPITVGLLPWVQGWGHLCGFLPEKVAAKLDFMSVHIYPDSKKLNEANEALRRVSVGKPVVIEEIFALSCSTAELENFMRSSREFASGWIGHYDGASLEELDALERAKKITIGQAIMRDWLKLFVKFKPELAR